LGKNRAESIRASHRPRGNQPIATSAGRFYNSGNLEIGAIFEQKVYMVLSLFTVALLPAVVGTAFIVAIVIFPMVLRMGLAVRYATCAAGDWQGRVLRRYQHSGTFAWMFAWFKLRMDPMFRELPDLVKVEPSIRSALDIGCGYGVTGCSLLEWLAEATIYGVDPNPTRVHVAAAAFGGRGQVNVGGAPDFSMPSLPEHFDAVLLLDVIHYISNEALELTLRRVHARTKTGGRLIIRSNISPSGGGSLKWKFAVISRKITGAYACHRSVDQIGKAIASAGFEVVRSEMSGANAESFWFIATA